MDGLPCPFIYANGKRCTGTITRIEAYKAEIIWERREDRRWVFGFAPRSHYHLFCSEKGNHAGSRRTDNPQMKFHWRQLPEEVRGILMSTNVDKQADDPTS
jgi:hypothetical protein